MSAREAYHAVILGAGAAGMMCAAHAARGGPTLILDHARAPGEKIRISGGGRCNFTNLYASPENFLSANPHFARSALKRYSQHDFIALVERYGVAYHEKTLGQLFCDVSAKAIIDLLLAEMAAAGAVLQLGTGVDAIARTADGFDLRLSDGRDIQARSFVIACGGRSIPKMGATDYGYRLARQFGLALVETRPALVPLVFGEDVLPRLKALAGIAVDGRASAGGMTFDEGLLFTHRGLSGPSILQISSYWREGAPLTIALAPHEDLVERLKAERRSSPRRQVATALGAVLPNRLAADMAAEAGMAGAVLADISDKRLQALAAAINAWVLTPAGTEGYRTAEVTLGGIATDGLDQRTMAATAVPGLYCIGEAVDVTGWLGGYNFQWAWSSGHAAGTAIGGG